MTFNDVARGAIADNGQVDVAAVMAAGYGPVVLSRTQE